MGPGNQEGNGSEPNTGDGADGGEFGPELESPEDLSSAPKTDLLYQLFGFHTSDIESGSPDWGSSFRNEQTDGTDERGDQG